LCLLLAAVRGVYADGAFVGLGPEINGLTRSGTAVGGGLSIGFDFSMFNKKAEFSAGQRTSFFHNFDTVGTLEALGLFRYYLPWLHFPKEIDGPFVQAEAGCVLFFEYGLFFPAFSGGFSAGWRFLFPQKNNDGQNWYVEPALRLGTPHIWGLNVTAGIRFKRDRVTVNIEQLPVEEPQESVKQEPTEPILSLTYTPEYFSPDGDGVDDELLINLSIKSDLPIASWYLEIRDTESGALFYRFEGEGEPPGQLIWDGRGSEGEPAQSAADYPYIFGAQDINGNAASIEGNIGVDILVIRDGDKLRIIIPFIVFRSNAADFAGLSAETIIRNANTFKRIAEMLNKFSDYQVLAEGHANPTTGPLARSKEEAALKSLSEDRARMAVEELVRRGVDRGRLFYTGAGSSQLLAPFDDYGNVWKNRRVEFILIK